MPPQPETPSKADAGIETIKRSLSAKWRIQWPVRDSTWSPSKSDPTRVEDKIATMIQYLYFQKPPKDGALDYALAQFERSAVQINSEWRFKPHGEPEVLPSVDVSKSALKQDFLKKRPTLPEKAITELTENLRHCLKSIADEVRNGRNFPRVIRNEGKNFTPASSFHWLRLF